MGPTVYTLSPTQTLTAAAPSGGWIMPYPTTAAPPPEPAQHVVQYVPEPWAEVPAALQPLPALPPVSRAAPSASPPNYPLSVTMCMEVVWHGEFERLFSTFRLYHSTDWILTPITEVPTESFKLFQDSAKVRFFCEDCGRGWTSMKGRVAFWFSFNQLTNSGEVKFKLFGQQCQRCTGNGKDKFHHAMWYPEEVVKVIQNLYNRIGTTYYGFQLPPIRIDRRTGKPRAQHDSKLCQACKDGICREGWMLN